MVKKNLPSAFRSTREREEFGPEVSRTEQEEMAHGLGWAPVPFITMHSTKHEAGKLRGPQSVSKSRCLQQADPQPLSITVPVFRCRVL